MRRRGLAPALLAAGLAPGQAGAHDAFGDLGPFHANLLHPLADPGQGLLLAALAVLLARQSLDTVRPAYAALAVGGAATILVGAVLGAEVALDPPGLRVTGVLAAALGITGLFGLRLGPAPAMLLAAGIAVASGLAIDLPSGPRAAGLAALGATLGIAVVVLLAWGLVDAASRRLGPVAGAVASSWVAAVGVMAAALP